MKKTLFGFSALALTAAAFVVPATGSNGHDEPSSARLGNATIDAGAGAENPAGEALVLNFTKITYQY